MGLVDDDQVHLGHGLQVVWAREGLDHRESGPFGPTLAIGCVYVGRGLGGYPFKGGPVLGYQFVAVLDYKYPHSRGLAHQLVDGG